MSAVVRYGRTDHHVDGEGFVGEVTFRLGGSRSVAIEMQGGSRRHTRLVGDARYLEVVVLVQVVARDGFVEAQLEVVAHAKDAVGRFGFAEDNRRAGVLGAADDGRGLRHIARAVATERDGSQVVTLLHRVTLAVEMERRDTAVLDHGFRTRSEVIEAVLGVERAEVHPVVVGLRGEFVLELDMVEVLVMDVEAVDGNGQVIACGVMRREGVHHPVLSRHGDGHVGRERHEMYAEIHLRRGQCAVGAVEAQAEVVVVHRTALHFDGLREGRTRHEPVVHALDERCAVDIDLRSVGVAGAVQTEVEAHAVLGHTGIHLSLVEQLDTERGAFVRRDVGLLVGIGRQFGFGHPLGAVTQRRAGIVEVGRLGLLVRTHRGAALGEEHIRAVLDDVVVGLLHFVQHLLGVGIPGGVDLGLVDADGDIAGSIGNEGESDGLGDSGRRAHALVGAEVLDGCKFHVELHVSGLCRHLVDGLQGLVLVDTYRAVFAHSGGDLGGVVFVESAGSRSGNRFVEQLQESAFGQAGQKGADHLGAGSLERAEQRLRVLAVVVGALVGVGVGVRRAGRSAVGAQARTFGACQHFLPLVRVDKVHPLGDLVVELVDLIHIYQAGVGDEHPVRVERNGVERGAVGLNQPVDGSSQFVRHGLRLRRVGEGHHQVLTLHGQTRNKRLQDIGLRVGERVVHRGANHHFLARYQVVGSAVGARALCQQQHRAGVE